MYYKHYYNNNNNDNNNNNNNNDIIKVQYPQYNKIQVQWIIIHV